MSSTRNPADLMRAEYKDGNVVITVPVSLLRFAQQERDRPLIIPDTETDRAGAYVASHILAFDEDGETMLSRFEQLLDDLCEEAAITEPWISFTDGPKSEEQESPNV